MRFNWNSVITACALLTEDATIDGPISGEGFTVDRDGDGFQIKVYPLEGAADTADPTPTPPAPLPELVTQHTAEAMGEIPPEPVASPPTEEAAEQATVTDTGTESPEVAAVESVPAAADSGPTATGQGTVADTPPPAEGDSPPVATGS